MANVLQLNLGVQKLRMIRLERPHIRPHGPVHLQQHVPVRFNLPQLIVRNPRRNRLLLLVGRAKVQRNVTPRQINPTRIDVAPVHVVRFGNFKHTRLVHHKVLRGTAPKNGLLLDDERPRPVAVGLQQRGQRALDIAGPDGFVLLEQDAQHRTVVGNHDPERFHQDVGGYLVLRRMGRIGVQRDLNGQIAGVVPLDVQLAKHRPHVVGLGRQIRHQRHIGLQPEHDLAVCGKKVKRTDTPPEQQCRCH
uniref:(northern house mosquito) hypothetical protein n=1 Tax=Culex pipiens TaxID=7175 RepID=A0A8D8AD42_CULPI